ncbi:unnamed protein product [Candida parapsilosis]
MRLCYCHSLVTTPITGADLLKAALSSLTHKPLVR